MNELKKVIFATGNMQKFDEVKAMLAPVEVEQKALDIPEYQGSFEFIIREKAKAACKQTGQAVLVDDAGIEVTAFHGMPGPYGKDFFDGMGSQKFADMLEKFEDRSAKAICMMAYCEPGQEPQIFEGIVEGTMVKTARGFGNHPKGWEFGYDPIFLPNGQEKTFAEMTKEEKNSMSHRTKALNQFKEWIMKKQETKKQEKEQ
tara:strand:+ start:221 stop:826 length:606 start_codon:yes stop_codon:yes gene_type:complete